jgi:protein disulfide-isomerase A1
VEGIERLEEEDQVSQVSRFLEGYKEGKTIKMMVKSQTFQGFMKIMGVGLVLVIVVMVSVVVAIIYLARETDGTQTRLSRPEDEPGYKPISGSSEGAGEGYRGDKED